MSRLVLLLCLVAFPAYANLGCECGVDGGQNRWMCQHPINPDDPNSQFTGLEFDPWCDDRCSTKYGNAPLPTGTNCTYESSSSSSTSSSSSSSSSESHCPCDLAAMEAAAALDPYSTGYKQVPPLSINGVAEFGSSSAAASCPWSH